MLRHVPSGRLCVGKIFGPNEYYNENQARDAADREAHVNEVIGCGQNKVTFYEVFEFTGINEATGAQC